MSALYVRGPVSVVHVACKRWKDRRISPLVDRDTGQAIGGGFRAGRVRIQGPPLVNRLQGRRWTYGS